MKKLIRKLFPPNDWKLVYKASDIYTYSTIILGRFSHKGSSRITCSLEYSEFRNKYRIIKLQGDPDLKWRDTDVYLKCLNEKNFREEFDILHKEVLEPKEDLEYKIPNNILNDIKSRMNGQGALDYTFECDKRCLKSIQRQLKEIGFESNYISHYNGEVDLAIGLNKKELKYHESKR